MDGSNVRRRRRRRGRPPLSFLLRQPVLLVHRRPRHPRPLRRLQVIAASKTFELDWLPAALPVLIVYGLIRRPGVLRMGVPGEPAPRDRGLCLPQAASTCARCRCCAMRSQDRPCRAGPVSADFMCWCSRFSFAQASNKGILRCRDRRLGTAGHRADGTALGLSRGAVSAGARWAALRGLLIRPGKREDRSQPAFTATRASMHACPIPRSSSQRSTDATRSKRAGDCMACGSHRRLPHARPLVVHPDALRRPPRTARNDPVRAFWCIARLRDVTRGRTFSRAAFPLHVQQLVPEGVVH